MHPCLCFHLIIKEIVEVKQQQRKMPETIIAIDRGKIWPLLPCLQGYDASLLLCCVRQGGNTAHLSHNALQSPFFGKYHYRAWGRDILFVK